jgi:hypothetical protein
MLVTMSKRKYAHESKMNHPSPEGITHFVAETLINANMYWSVKQTLELV